MGDWITIGGFWVSIFMAIVAISAVLVSYIVYRASSAPNVIVYADDDERRPTMIVLVDPEHRPRASKERHVFSSAGFAEGRLGISTMRRCLKR